MAPAMRRSLSARMGLIVFVVLFSTRCGSATDPVQQGEPPGQQVAVRAGCWSAGYSGYGRGQLGCGLLNSLGHAQADQDFGEETSIQSQFWQGVPAGVWIFDECGPGSANAISMPNRNILFGYHLFWQRVFATGSTLPIAAVLAHEWAHQIQFQYGWMFSRESTSRPTELEADAFSGYYMVLAKSWAWDQIHTFYQSLYQLGDYNFSDRGHHGTPDERVQAGYMGVNTGIYAVQNGIRYSYQDLHTIFRGAIGASVTLDLDAFAAAVESDHEVLPLGIRELARYLAKWPMSFDRGALVQLTREQRERVFPH